MSKFSRIARWALINNVIAWHGSLGGVEPYIRLVLPDNRPVVVVQKVSYKGNPAGFYVNLIGFGDGTESLECDTQAAVIKQLEELKERPAPFIIADLKTSEVLGTAENKGAADSKFVELQQQHPERKMWIRMNYGRS